MWVRVHGVTMHGLDWVMKLLDWDGLDLAKWTHVQLCDGVQYYGPSRRQKTSR